MTTHEVNLASSSKTSSQNLKKGIFLTRSGISENNNERIGEGSRSKHLVEIPLIPQPPIQCSNLGELTSTSFVNVVLESDRSANQSTSSTFFRVSDDSNKEICRVQESRRWTRRNLQEKVKYLECCDKSGQCIMLIGYPIGLGEVALLSPSEELLGECQSNVDFICLSVKVKYNFYGTNGNRLMKMTALLQDEGNEQKFILMVKRTQKEKLALIKMGTLKTCCHIKFKSGQATVLERLQIIALWIGFMHNELHDEVQPTLIERQAAIKLHKKESQKQHKSKKNQEKHESVGDTENSNNQDAIPTPMEDTTVSPESQPEEASQSKQSSPGKVDDSIKATMIHCKNLVKSKLSLRKTQREYSINSKIEKNKEINEYKAVMSATNK